jgi:hypothetical protein
VCLETNEGSSIAFLARAMWSTTHSVAPSIFSRDKSRGQIAETKKKGATGISRRAPVEG